MSSKTGRARERSCSRSRSFAEDCFKNPRNSISAQFPGWLVAWFVAWSVGGLFGRVDRFWRAETSATFLRAELLMNVQVQTQGKSQMSGCHDFSTFNDDEKRERYLLFRQLENEMTFPLETFLPCSFHVSSFPRFRFSDASASPLENFPHTTVFTE